MGLAWWLGRRSGRLAQPRLWLVSYDRGAMSEEEAQVEEQLEIAARIIADASYVIALVGAGMSKESGIPAFRGGDGLWDQTGEPPVAG